jgi:hypothetical protein
MAAIKTACRRLAPSTAATSGPASKLDYLQQLGVNALWISSPLEQIHGWVGGGTKGDFPHYAYHGYYTQDWTSWMPTWAPKTICAILSMKRTSAVSASCSISS